MRFGALLMAAAQSCGGVAAGGGGGPPIGTELWPDPTFATGTGLTVVNSFAGSGQWSTDGSGVQATCTANSPPTSSAGQVYHYVITVSINDVADTIRLVIGGTSSPALVVGTNTGDLTIVTGGSALLLRDTENANAGLNQTTITAASVKRTS